MENDWPEIPDLRWDNLVLTDRQILQREQDHFGFIVLGSPDVNASAGDVIEGIHIGIARAEAPDITIRCIGLSSVEEWREHVLFNFGPDVLRADFARMQRHPYIIRAIAE